MTYPIINSALDDRLGFIGTSGSGKTYNAGSAVERLLNSKARVVIIDPLGVWWGLRLLADGKTPSQFHVAIFGGPHGDLPLTEHAGALLGETAAGMVESCIVDLSDIGTRSAERRFMTAFLDALYRTRKRGGEPFHFVVDEADLWAPQKPQAGDEVLLGHMENIVRRGRVMGFIPWLISQRPAVLNKNVLSQVDGLIAFKLTSTQDRDALDAWIEGQADKAEGKKIKDSLPAMQVGQGVVWLPNHGILKTVQFPPKLTFDSSRASKRGEKIKSHGLKPLNLTALKDRLASVEAEAKANDPLALRSEIGRLKAERARLEKQIADAKPAVDRDALRTAEHRGFEHAKKKFGAPIDRAFKRAVGELVTLVRKHLEEVNLSIIGALKDFHKTIPGIDAELQFEPTSSPLPLSQWTPSEIAQFKHHQQAGKPAIIRISDLQAAATGKADGVIGAERRPLSVLAGVYPAGMTEAQWATGAGLKRTGGTWSTYLSRLRSAGRIVRHGDLFYVTEDGLSVVGDNVKPMPPPGPALVEFWMARIPGSRRLLKRLADIYPHAIDREQLAVDLDLTASGGTFSTYLSRVRSSGLIEEDGKMVRLAAALMESAA